MYSFNDRLWRAHGLAILLSVLATVALFGAEGEPALHASTGLAACGTAAGGFRMLTKRSPVKLNLSVVAVVLRSQRR